MMLTEEQQRVFDWLNSELGLPGYAESYSGALHLLSTKPPGYLSLVAHVGRDLMNSLGPTIAGIRRSQVQYVQLVDQLQRIWKKAYDDTPSALGGGTQGKQPCPPGISKAVEKLIDQHVAGRNRNSQADAHFFDNCLDYDDIDMVPTTLLKDWREARDHFMKSAHIRHESFPKDTPPKIEESFQVLHSLLYVAAASALVRLKGINEILEETNE